MIQVKLSRWYFLFQGGMNEAVLQHMSLKMHSIYIIFFAFISRSSVLHDLYLHQTRRTPSFASSPYWEASAATAYSSVFSKAMFAALVCTLNVGPERNVYRQDRVSLVRASAVWNLVGHRVSSTSQKVVFWEACSRVCRTKCMCGTRMSNNRGVAQGWHSTVSSLVFGEVRPYSVYISELLYLWAGGRWYD